MKKIYKNIELILENCDTIVIPQNQIKMLRLEKCIGSYESDFGGSIVKSMECRKLILQISKEGNKEYSPFKQKKFKEYIFDRIRKGLDITSIDIEYKSGEKEKIYVLWKNDYSQVNAYQKCYDLKCGDLLIIIGKKKNAHLCERMKGQ